RIIAKDKGIHFFSVMIKPSIGVMALERPKHNIKALFQNFFGVQGQNRYGSLWGNIKEGLGFVFKLDFTHFRVFAGIKQGEAGTHGIGATAERIKNLTHGMKYTPQNK